MKKILSMLLASVILLAACSPKEGIEVREASVRTAAQGSNSALYFVIHNYNATDDELIGVSAEFAEAAEIHESSMVNDVMQMRMVESVPLASGEDVEFASGGLHVMLVGVKEELKAGSSVEVVLHFKNSEDIRLQVPVQEGADEHGRHGG